MKEYSNRILRASIFILIGIGGVWLVFHVGDIRYGGKDVVAIVNGENIYAYNIEILYEQAAGEYSYREILNDLIDEQVVLTQAEGLGIKFTDEELRNAVLEFKSNFPEIYKHGVHLYGEAEYNKGIERQKIYKAVFQHIVNKEVSNSIKNDFYTFMTDKYEPLCSATKEEIIEKYKEEFHLYIFDCWLLKQRKNAIIKIISQEEKYDEIF